MRTHLDLFSGVGGFALAAHWAGFRTVAFVECDPFAQRVLGKHWPDVPMLEDVRDVCVSAADYPLAEITGEHFCERHSEELWACPCLAESQWDELFPYEIDLITAGWPCQDISAMGERAGLDGGRSGLWFEAARIIRQIRPRFAILENVPNVLAGDGGRWFGTVLGGLAAMGYDAEWGSFRGELFGARQTRERVFIVAHDNRRQPPVAHKRALMPSQINAAPFGEPQPIPQRNRMPDRLSDRVDITRRISSCANAIIPQIAFQIIKRLPQ